MMSSLEELFALQKGLMDRLGIELHRHPDIDVYHDHFVAACIGLASEALEVLDEINVATRPWAEKPAEEIQDAVAKEAIDVLFYLIEIFVFLNIRPFQVYKLYEEKWRINMKRASTKSKD